MKVVRALVPLVLAVVVLLASAPAAMAHTELESSSPSEDQSVATVPTSISLTFGEAVTLPADPVRVTGPGGVTWTTGTPTIAGAVVTVPVQPSGPAGAYTVSWTVTADDGDKLTGVVHFTLATAATPATTTAPTTTAAPTTATTPTSVPVAASQDGAGGGGVPIWVWIVVAVVVVGGLAVMPSQVVQPGDGCGFPDG